MPDLEDFHVDAEVFASDGEKLGTLKGVVLRRDDLTVTRIVVDVGFLRSGHAPWQGGMGLDYDRVVPASVLRSVDDKRLVLSITAAEFKDAPAYTTDYFEPPQDLSPEVFDLTDIANRAQALAGLIGSTPAFWLVERKRRAKDEVDLEEGTAVWRIEPHQKLGEVHRVLADPVSNKAVAIVVRRGFLLHREAVLPVRFVAEVLDGVVRVDISDADLARLEDYEDD